MSYEIFRCKVKALLKKVGGGIRVSFYTEDNDDGFPLKYFAKFSDGTLIIGNPDSLKVTVRFGSGHQAMAAI